MGLLSTLNKNIISIDVGSYEIKIIEGRNTKEGIKVNKSLSFQIPENVYVNGYIKDEKSLRDKIREELKKNKINQGISYISIKSSAIISREIPFPVLSSKEIEGILKYQLEEYLPMDSSKYIIQHKIIGKFFDDGNEKLNVLVVAIPKDMVDMHYSFLKEIGLKPEVMDYQSNSISKLISYVDKVNDNIDVTGKTIAAVDLGYDSTNITIIENGMIQTSRVIELGGRHLDNNAMSLIAMTDEELLTKKIEIDDVSIIEGGYSEHNRYVNIVKTTIEGIIDRIDKVVKYHISKQIDNEIDIVLLYGGLSNINGVEKLFANYFNIPTFNIKKIDKVNTLDDVNKYLNCISALIRDDEV